MPKHFADSSSCNHDKTVTLSQGPKQKCGSTLKLSAKYTFGIVIKRSVFTIRCLPYIPRLYLFIQLFLHLYFNTRTI